MPLISNLIAIACQAIVVWESEYYVTNFCYDQVESVFIDLFTQSRPKGHLMNYDQVDCHFNLRGSFAVFRQDHMHKFSICPNHIADLRLIKIYVHKVVNCGCDLEI